jgi:tRNA(fMet)-specific endonuclease VapC
VSYLLDTDTCSIHLRTPSGLAARFQQYSGRLNISTVSVGELYVWAFRLKNSSRRFLQLQELFDEVAAVPFDLLCAEEFGKARASLMRHGINIPRVDLTIASVALAHDWTLVTHNTKDFERIPGLRLEDWISG